jgi:uncharacterized protein YjbI with pentapeptide repeats
VTQPASRPEANAALLSEFDNLVALSRRAQLNDWPFTGLRVVLPAVADWTLSVATITDTDFALTELERARWDHVTLRRCTLSADRVRQLSLIDSQFEDCTVDLGDIVGGVLRNVTFVRCRITASNVSQLTIEQVTLRDSQVVGISFSADSTIAGVTLENVKVEKLRTFGTLASRISANACEIARVRIGGGSWRDLRFTATTLSAVQVTQAAVESLTCTGGAIENCGQSEGTLSACAIADGAKILGLTIAGVTIDGFSVTTVVEGRRLAILRSVLKGLAIARSVLVGLEIRETHVAERARIDATSITALDLRGSVVDQLAVQGGTLEGAVPVDNARISHWTLDGVTLGASFALTGSNATIEQSDARLVVRG